MAVCALVLASLAVALVAGVSAPSLTLSALTGGTLLALVAGVLNLAGALINLITARTNRDSAREAARLNNETARINNETARLNASKKDR